MVSIIVPWLLCLHLLVVFVASIGNKAADGMSLRMFTNYGYSYKVKIAIGTFKLPNDPKPKYMMYNLKVDLSSDLLWLECEGCTRCFKPPILNVIPFPFSNSSSGSHNVDDGPTYSINYDDGTYSIGYPARETFSFNSSSSKSFLFKKQTFTINNILFGCGIQNKMRPKMIIRAIDGSPSVSLSLSGVMGLGWGPLSFVEQTNSVSKGRFSYCLPTILSQYTEVKTYLRFGNDIPLNKGNIINSTPLKRIEKDLGYHLEMVGISLNNHRLNISNDLFLVKNKGGGGGCIINFKVPVSHIIQPAYEKLKYAVIQYFSKIPGIFRVNKLTLPFPFEQDQLCYSSNNFLTPFDKIKFPTITFHFSGKQANLVLSEETAFSSFRIGPMIDMYFCLALVPDPSTTIIGLYQQLNHRFVYDRNHNELLFYPENCLKNS
ncbi:aspartic proteinase CDR1-like [Impatiens glandulifera]|uniref:aspartic proteinase CDR1-like n=1 Tax=Impatiens glandulifera TaxID=253017 RepID=UPI001FB0EC4D|nr:aspartic proteinase CDR1-like [Impatiens glandulifera]